MFREGLHYLGFDFDPSVVHISEPVASCCSLTHCSISYFLHVEVRYSRWHWRVHDIAMFIPLETIIILEVGGGEAEVKIVTNLISGDVCSIVHRAVCSQWWLVSTASDVGTDVKREVTSFGQPHFPNPVGELTGIFDMM